MHEQRGDAVFDEVMPSRVSDQMRRDCFHVREPHHQYDYGVSQQVSIQGGIDVLPARCAGSIVRRSCWMFISKARLKMLRTLGCLRDAEWISRESWRRGFVSRSV